MDDVRFNIKYKIEAYAIPTIKCRHNSSKKNNKKKTPKKPRQVSLIFCQWFENEKANNYCDFLNLDVRYGRK